MRIAFAGLVVLVAIFFVVILQQPGPWTPIAYPDGMAGQVVWGPPVGSLDQCREWLGDFHPGVEYECGKGCVYDLEEGFVVCDEMVGEGG